MDLRRTAMTWMFGRLWSLERARRKQEAISAKRRAAGGRRKVYYYHQVTMPHARLTGQVLAKLAAAYDVDIIPRLCGAPDSGMIAQHYEEKFYPFMRKDAADIAPFYGLGFEDIGRQPSESLALRGSRILAGALGHPSFFELVPQVDAAVWNEDESALEALAKAHSPVDESATRTLMKEHEAERLKHGYVYGGTFHFEGEWYFGPDRLNYLEERLTTDGARRDGGSEPVVPRPEIRGLRPDGADRVSLEVFASVRSPYTHEAFQRVFDLAATTGCKLVGRPVRPIIMRFERTPTRLAQVRYVYFDAARECERYGVPKEKYYEMAFGPTERVYSLYEWADEREKGLELLYSFTRATFAEGLDAGKDATMKHVVERVGLSWDEARPLLGRDGWFPRIEENENAMLDEGLWGVPSFRVTAHDGRSFSTWGADRLWLVEAKIAELSGGNAAP